MYYDVLINDFSKGFTSDSWKVISNLETFSKVKCVCKKEIRSVYCFVYVRKVEKEMITKWKMIFNQSDYFSNLNNQTDYICKYLDKIFNKELKNAK